MVQISKRGWWRENLSDLILMLEQERDRMNTSP